MRKGIWITVATLALALTLSASVSQADPRAVGVVYDAVYGISFQGGTEFRICKQLQSSVNGVNTFRITRYEDLDHSQSLTRADRIIMVWFQKELA